MNNERGALRILSLNIDHGLLAEELLQYVKEKSQDVSVFCFQESDDDIHHAFYSTLGAEFEGYHVVKLFDDGYTRISTYVRKDIIVDGVEALFENDNDMGLALRCMLRLAGNTRLDVTNVYGLSQPGHKLDTPERLRMTRELITRGRDSTNPQVFIGDFNLLPEAQSVREFAESGYRNLIDDYSIPTTRNERAWRRYPDNPQLFADYAFVRGGGMTYDFDVENVTVSDHLPLRLAVVLE